MVNRAAKRTVAELVGLAHAQVSAGQLSEAEQTIRRAMREADDSEQTSLRQLQARVAEQRVRAAGSSLR